MIKNYNTYIKEANINDPYGEEDWDEMNINAGDRVTMKDPVDSLMISVGNQIYYENGSKYFGKEGFVWDLRTFNVSFGVGPMEWIFVYFSRTEGNWFRKDKFKKI